MKRRAWIALAATALLEAPLGCTVDTNVDGRGSDMDGGLEGGRDAATQDVIPLDAGPPCTDFNGPDRLIEVLDGRLLGEGATLDHVAVEPPAQIVLTSSPYRYGVLLVSGYDDSLLGAAPSLSDLASATPRVRGLRDAFRSIGGAGTPPSGFDLGSDDTYTILAEGEICLPAGSTTGTFDVDDRGVLEIEGVVTMVQATPGAHVETFVVPTDGFHRIRLAYSNDAAVGHTSFDVISPTTTAGDCRSGELRVDVSSVEGRDATVWASRVVDAAPWNERIDVDDSAERFEMVAYPDVGLPSRDNWSLRVVGRHTVTDDHATLNVSSDDAHRIWVDGVFLGGRYGGGALSGVYELPLRGRRDFVVELEQGGGSAELAYTIGGVPFEAADARPLTAFGGTPYGVGSSPNADLDNGGTRAELLTLLAPSGSPSMVEVSAIIDGVEDPARVDVSVTAPNGMSRSATLDVGGQPAAEPPRRWVFHRAYDFGSALGVAAGTWTVTVANRGPNRIHWDSAGVLAQIGGRSAPYATSGTLEMAPRTYRDEVEVRRVVADLETPLGTSVQLAVRAGSTPAQVEGFGWLDVAPDGSLPVAQRGRVVQVRATLVSDGTATPRVRDVRLIGHACRRCASASCPDELSSDGLVALYTFEEGAGDRVLDRSGAGTPLDLRIARVDRVEWGDGALAVQGDTIIGHVGPPTRLYAALMEANAITIEAWVAPDAVDQRGPARIVVSELGVLSRNFAIGQERDVYECRLRRGSSDDMPFAISGGGAVATSLQQLVLVRGSDGVGQLYVDGVPNGDPADWGGDFGSWETWFPFSLANSPENLDRPWHGDLVLVALYARPLSAEEVARHFALGGRLSAAE